MLRIAPQDEVLSLVSNLKIDCIVAAQTRNDENYSVRIKPIPAALS